MSVVSPRWRKALISESNGRNLSGVSARIAALVLVVAAPAWACGACTDALVERAWWWVRAVPFAFLGLLLEACAFFLVVRHPRSRRTPFMVAAGALFIVALCAGAGMSLSVTAASLALLAGLVRSLWLEQGGRRIAALRLAPVIVGLVVGMVMALPSRQTTHALVELERRAPFGAPSAWVIGELGRRPGAIAEIESVDVPRAERLVELHRALGGPASFRARVCARRATNEQPDACSRP